MKKIVLGLFVALCGLISSSFAQTSGITLSTGASNTGLISRINHEFGNKNWGTGIISTVSSILLDLQGAIISFDGSGTSYTGVVGVSSMNNNQLINTYLVNGSSTLLYTNTGLQVTQYSVQNKDLVGFYISFGEGTKLYKLLWTGKKGNNISGLEKLNSITNQIVGKYLLLKKPVVGTGISICENKDGFYKNISYEGITYQFILKKTHQLFAVNLSGNIVELDCGSTITKDYELPLAGSTVVVGGSDNFFLLNNTINKKTLSHIFNLSTNTITPLHASIKNIGKFSKEKISGCVMNSQQGDLLQITCKGKKLTYKWVYNVKNMMIVRTVGK